MIEYYQIISCFLTNGIRIFFCLFCVSELLKLSKISYNAVFLSATGALLVTCLSLFHLSQFYLIGIEIIILISIAYYLFRRETRMCLFLIFFYEIGVALWEFLASYGLGTMFHSDRFIDNNTPEHIMTVWIVHFFLIGIIAFMIIKRNMEDRITYRLFSIISILGMFGVVALSEQNIIPVDDDLLTVWMILSLLTLAAVFIFNFNRQYEMEKEISQLKANQAELIKRDYQSLSNTYAANAKLFHDIHNHIDMIYCYLTQDKTTKAIQYLEDLRTPIQEITKNVWTGDEAIDYLISSKMAFAEQANIQTEINIEFPNNTDIRSSDLIAILGNLLDNAFEAARNSKDDLRFIHLTIRRINQMIVVKVENGCEVMPIVSEGELQTSKRKGLHGWGLKSARAAAEHYDGTIETSYAKNTFRAVATLSYHAIHTK